MIKTGDIRHREKMALETRVQVADTVFVTKEMMILNHIFDDTDEDREAVFQVMTNLYDKIKSVSIKHLRELYKYNDEQLQKTRVKWNNAGVIKFRGVTYKLVSPLELTTYRARLLLKMRLVEVINYKLYEKYKEFDGGDLKFIFKPKEGAKMNFKPDWMNW